MEHQLLAALQFIADTFVSQTDLTAGPLHRLRFTVDSVGAFPGFAQHQLGDNPLFRQGIFIIGGAVRGHFNQVPLADFRLRLLLGTARQGNHASRQDQLQPSSHRLIPPCSG